MNEQHTDGMPRYEPKFKIGDDVTSKFSMRSNRRVGKIISTNAKGPLPSERYKVHWRVWSDKRAGWVNDGTLAHAAHELEHVEHKRFSDLYKRVVPAPLQFAMTRTIAPASTNLENEEASHAQAREAAQALVADLRNQIEWHKASEEKLIKEVEQLKVEIKECIPVVVDRSIELGQARAKIERLKSANTVLTNDHAELLTLLASSSGASDEDFRKAVEKAYPEMLSESRALDNENEDLLHWLQDRRAQGVRLAKAARKVRKQLKECRDAHKDKDDEMILMQAEIDDLQSALDRANKAQHDLQSPKLQGDPFMDRLWGEKFRAWWTALPAERKADRDPLLHEMSKPWHKRGGHEAAEIKQTSVGLTPYEASPPKGVAIGQGAIQGGKNKPKPITA
jgi:hypothetical protein